MKKQTGKKKVLLLCQYFYPEQKSSATLPYDTAVRLTEAGMEVDVLCGRPKEYTSETDVPLREIVNGVSIHRVRYAQPDRKRVIGRLINYFSFTTRVLFSLREIGSHDVVIVYSNPPILPMAAALANRFFRTKIIGPITGAFLKRLRHFCRRAIPFRHRTVTGHVPISIQSCGWTARFLWSIPTGSLISTTGCTSISVPSIPYRTMRDSMKSSSDAVSGL